MKITAKSKSVQSAIDRMSKERGSINVPALVLMIRGKDIDAEIEALRKRLKNRHEAELLSLMLIDQDESDTGSHSFLRFCAITEAAANPVSPSDYPQYESLKAEWVVVSGETYESAIPRGNMISEVRIANADEHGFVTVTLMPTEEEENRR